MLRHRYVPPKACNDACASTKLPLVGLCKDAKTYRDRFLSPSLHMCSCQGLPATPEDGHQQQQQQGDTTNTANPSGKVKGKMHAHHYHSRRRKRRPLHGVKSVDVTRGKTGYGFTISGQHPCVLSCIVSGSAAERAGLKPGDYLVSVNGENVSKAPHDNVVRMIGTSTGTLTLQVAENYNSSDSSDEDYHVRPKSRYPNRVRPRHLIGMSPDAKVLKEQSQNARIVPSSQEPRIRSSHGHNKFNSNNQHKKTQPVAQASGSHGRSNSPSDGLIHVETKWGRLTSCSSSRLPDAGKAGNVRAYGNAKSHSSSSLKPSEERFQGGSSSGNIRPGVYPGGPASTPAIHPQRPHSQPELNHSRIVVTASVERQRSPREIPAVMSQETVKCGTPPGDGAVALGQRLDEEEMDHDGMVIAVGRDDSHLKAVIGYVGTIEMPSHDNRQQNIRNAVRRLRVEQKIHTLILMEVYESSIKLTNTIGNVMAEYSAEKLAFSGVCPDDKRFFGLVTLSRGGDASGAAGSQEGCSPSSSCHMFMVDPELQAHNIHAQKATAFNIECTVDPETQNCLEFPSSATPIVTGVSRLYRGRAGGLDTDVIRSQIFAEPMVAPQRHHSSSSNSHDSDSGLGFSKEDNQLNERVYIVDVPAGFARHEPGRWSQRDSLTGSAPDLHHLSPDVSTMPTPHHHHFRHPNPQRMMSVRRLLNSSVSSEESLQRLVTDRLNLRAMPDPSSLWKSHSSNALELNHSADSMRRSMHKYLQARQHHLREAPGTSSDQESMTSMCYRADNMSRSASHSSIQARPVSAPYQQLTPGLSVMENKAIAVVMEDKLSARAFLPLGPTLRSPSAPPLTTFNDDCDDPDMSSDSDDDFDYDEGMNQKSARFDRDQTTKLRLGDEPRRFSEGFILAKKREKEKGVQADFQKWTKTGSLRRPKTSKKVLSQSHESLIVTDGELSGGVQKLVSAGSVNSISQYGTKKGATVGSHNQEVGRVAGWAVNFDKLLKDRAGLSVFTDFLKKEFSEENILFWKTCVDYKKIDDSDQRKSKAKEIYDKHVSAKATEPINIDSRARQHCEEQLELSSPELFDLAQQQLMKQDSYSRFLRSDLYKSCLMAEIEGTALDFLLEDDHMPELPGKDKKIKKPGDPDVKRRKSLLPWVKNKGTKPSTKSKKNKENKDKEEGVNTNTNNMKKAAFVSVDLSLMRKEVCQSTELQDMEVGEYEAEAHKGNYKFCRVILPDGATTVVCAKPGQTIRTVLGKLCEKRSLSMATVDVFLLGSDKALDLGNDISSLGSKEIIIERRVLFRMDLPNQKSIGVKAKPNRPIRDVFKPILLKYGYKIDHVAIQLSGHTGTVDVDCPTSSVDNQRVVVIPKEDIVEWSSNGGGRRLTHGRPPVPARASKTIAPMSSVTVATQHASGPAALDEITNQVFEDLMQGKSELAHNFDELGILDPDRPAKLIKNADEPRLSGLFGLLRRESLGAKDSGKPKIKNKVTFAVQKSGSRKRGKAHEDDHFLELLSKMQSQRIDDQRGLGRESLEVPSFLLKGSDHGHGSTSHNPSADDPKCQTTGELNIGDFDEIDPDLMGSKTQLENESTSQRLAVNKRGTDSRSIRSFKTFGSPTDKMAFTNNSFSQEFVVPSYDQALMYFDTFSHPTNPDFDDPMLMVRSLSDIGLDDAFNILPAELHQTQLPEFSRRSAFQPTCKKIFQGDFVVPKASPEKFSPNSTDQEPLSPTGSEGLVDYPVPMAQRQDTCESGITTMLRIPVLPPVIYETSADTCYNNHLQPINLQPFRNFGKTFTKIPPSESSDVKRPVHQRSSCHTNGLNEPICSDCGVPVDIINENMRHPASVKPQTSNLKKKLMVRVNGTSDMVHNNNVKSCAADTTFLKPRTHKNIGTLERQRSHTRRPVYLSSPETEITVDTQVTFV